jgi:hypothetical protein
MPFSGLRGPFDLTKHGVEAAVDQRSPGAYALGRTNEVGTFVISFVGRADSDLGARLLEHVAVEWYPHFKAVYCATPNAAFEKECSLFHDFGQRALDNKTHPAPPPNSTWQCPRCRVFALADGAGPVNHRRDIATSDKVAVMQ